MSVNMMAASLRCSVFSEGTNALKQRPPGMKPANSPNASAAFANPASVAQVARFPEALENQYDVENDPQPSRISPTARRPQANRAVQVVRNEFETFFLRAEAA